MMNVIRFIILLLIFFVCFLIMAKHAEENEMVDEHQAIADLDKKLQLKDLQDAVKEYKAQKDRADSENDSDQAESYDSDCDVNYDAVYSAEYESKYAEKYAENTKE